MTSVLALETPRRQRRMLRRHHTGFQIATYAPLSVLAIFAAGPIVIFVFGSLKTQADLAANPLGLPKTWHWSNFVNAWTEANVAAGLRNSLILVVATVVITCVVASLAAYSLARVRPAGANSIQTYLFVGSALPAQLFLVPLFYLWAKIGLYNTYPGLILIYVGIFSPFATLLLRSFLVGLPTEYEEAARVDGAGELSVLLRVVLPQAWSGILTVGLVTGLATYNEFLFAVTFVQSQHLRPVGLALYSFRAGFLVNQPLVDAAGVIMLLPVLVIFLLLQRRFTAGMSSSGLVG